MFFISRFLKTLMLLPAYGEKTVC